MTDLIPTPTPTTLGAPSRERISRYLSESRSPATRRAYGAAWRDWLQYCIKTQAQAFIDVVYSWYEANKDEIDAAIKANPDSVKR